MITFSRNFVRRDVRFLTELTQHTKQLEGKITGQSINVFVLCNSILLEVKKKKKNHVTF